MTDFDGSIQPARVVLAGVRELDPAERDALERSEATVIGASTVETLVAVKNALDGAPVYVHLDVDVLDPEALPVQDPAPGGLPPEKLYDLLEAVMEDSELGLEITAFAGEEGADVVTRLIGSLPTIPRCPCRRLSERPARSRSRGGWPGEHRGSESACRTAAAAVVVDDLHERREHARLGGGEEKIAKQHAQDKLTARERLALLVDEGTFTELGIHGRPHFSQRAMEGKEAPADGVVTGYGKVEGRLVAVAAYDFTVMAGSMGMTGEMKMARLRELALQKRIPLIWLLDSAGARIQEAAGSCSPGSGHLFREEVVMSGVIPQIAALMGPCAAGTAYIPGLADFVPMVKGRGSMALAGPHLTKAVTGEDVTQEELGGSKVHTRISGVGDLEVGSDEECIQAIKDYLSFFPRTARSRRPSASRPTRSSGWTRSCSTSCPTRRASRTTCTT